uniref:Uncharacterized protein n=1 Tax=Parascaris equorum TaxID=6256 RepID=A0A914RZG1_PAREQ
MKICKKTACFIGIPKAAPWFNGFRRTQGTLFGNQT